MVSPLTTHPEGGARLLSSEDIDKHRDLNALAEARTDGYVVVGRSDRTPSDVEKVFGEPVQPHKSTAPTSRMNYTHWAGEIPADEGIGCYKLHDATIVPGRITWKAQGYHQSGQLLLTKNQKLVSASYANIDGVPTLPDTYFGSASSEGALQELIYLEKPRLDGVTFHLGSVPRHFGHFLLEGLSKVWAYKALSKILEIDRITVYESAIPNYARHVLADAGIPLNKVVCLSETCVAETCYAPEISYRTHNWGSQLQSDVWADIRDASTTLDDSYDGKKIFLSRSNNSRRRAVNETDVEQMFEKAGYKLVQPENMNIREQIQLARSAYVMAGFVGSQMYLGAFQETGAKRIIMAPNDFYLPDDALISHAVGTTVSVSFGTPVFDEKRDAIQKWRMEKTHVEEAIERAS